MTEPVHNLFLDKIQISTQILEKEGQLDGELSQLLEQIQGGFLISVEDIERSDRCHHSWRIIREIYSFLQFNKIELLKKKISDKIEILEHYMKKYKRINKKLSFDELLEADEIIREIISLSGYHEDKTRDDEEGWGDYDDTV